MTRLYFNLTNKCNENCEFCCMYSSPYKNSFLPFDKFKEIIDKLSNKNNDFLENDDFETNYDGELFCAYKDYSERPDVTAEIKKCVEQGLRS